MAKNNNTMPNNLEAEQALISCMLIDNEILSDVLEQLDDNDFYHESHRYIISAMKMVYAERKPVDIVTLCDRLDSDGNLDKAGGISYVTELAQITPSSANYKYYLDIVKRDSINRNLIRAAGEIAAFAKSSDDSVKSIQNAEALIYDISRVNDTSSVKDIREGTGVDAVIDKFEKLSKDKDAFRGLSTGFTRLDRLTNGLQKSDLIVLAARPGMGKTSLAMNIVENAALRCDAVCAVFSLEMPEVQIIQRLLCSFANVSMADALAGKLTANDWRKLVKASDALKKSRINIDDSSRVTPMEILSKCRRIKSRNNGKLDLVMIDYIQLMSSGKESSEQNRTQEVAAITRELKIMAKELNVPVIALSQLRRIQSGEPQLSDLRESGAIEQDADIVMFISRPDVNVPEEELVKKNIKKGMADLIVAKHRNGGLDRIPLRFKGELTKFVNPDPEQGYEPPPENPEAKASDIPFVAPDEAAPF
ncbi:MAG: replicative DNA helicase [Clostridia bacterium]|nr:replicative DNA helicase [Clostridia bacterium]